MKSVAFLRNTWKKKSTDGPVSPSTPQVSQKSRSATAPGRSLVVMVKHLPIEQASTSRLEGSWQSSETCQPPSPIYEQFAQHNDDRGLVSQESSLLELQATYRAHSDIASDKAESTRASTFPSPSTRLRSPNDAHYSAPTSSAQSPKLPSRTLSPSLREEREAHMSDRQPSVQGRRSPPYSPSLPSLKLLPPLDLNYGPGIKLDSLLEGKTCKCVPPMHSKNPSLCPRNMFPDPQGTMAPTHISSGLHHSPKTAHAALNLSRDTKRRTLYHNTGSTPHLPYKERVQLTAKSDASTYSADSSEAEQFPLSLFPLPPPLIIRKKVPTPLVLKNTFTSSAQSSRDSSPVRTPTTPKLHGPNHPSQSNVVVSPTKKSFAGRSPAIFSPPPFSPPNSPLPQLPVSREGGQHSVQQSFRPLRLAQSNASLRDPLPFPATHRFTSSEPISEQSKLPTRRPEKSRLAERPKNIQTYMDKKEQMSTPGADTHIEWGYAF